MVTFKAQIEKFAKQGEKTGWTYFEIPLDIAEKINPKQRTSYRVKGTLDDTKIKGIAILPMGEGNFIMPLNAEIRKQIKKRKGDELLVKIELDREEYQLNSDLVECLQDEKIASDNFYKLPKSHQNYFSKFIDSAKTEATKTKRIVQVVNAMHFNMTYSEMIRSSSK